MLEKELAGSTPDDNSKQERAKSIEHKAKRIKLRAPE